MAKQYGLIIPGMQKKKIFAAPTREITRPSIFDEESSDENENGPPQLKMNKSKSFAQASAAQKRVASKIQEKALAEDATIFQYDEVYDEIETKRDLDLNAKKNEPKKAKYIEHLLVVAERRKLENELRVERLVQKERDLEGEEFKDKEKFVTAGYRKKLEEMRKLDDIKKHEEYLETIGDVTKQKDLDGFYRHLYEQKLGKKENDIKPEKKEINNQLIKADKSKNQRTYRKRRASEDNEPAPEQIKIKRHLENNIDADSDFSIDSSSEDEDKEKTEPKKDDNAKNKNTNTEKRKTTVDNKSKILTDKGKVGADSQDMPNNAKPAVKKSIPTTSEHVEKNPETTKTQVKEKKSKKDIWKKRTIGQVFDDAMQRYYKRKAQRNG